jgi:hypothetical protein
MARYKLSSTPSFTLPEFTECVSCVFSFPCENWRCSCKPVFTNSEGNCSSYIAADFSDVSNDGDTLLEISYRRRSLVSSYLLEHAEKILEV